MVGAEELERQAPDVVEETEEAPQPLRPLVVRALVCYLVARLATLVGAGMAMLTLPGMNLASVLTMWDGSWYLRLITGGYPSEVPMEAGRVASNTAGFFPLYPIVVRAGDVVLPGGHLVAALGVATIFGALATVVVSLLADTLVGRSAAERAVALFCFFPGSVVLSLAYSEGLMLAAAASCLLLLHRRQWLAAGVAAALASASRPTGIVLAASCAWAAVFAIRQRREWRALVAPLIAPLGMLAFFVFLEARTGDLGFWFRTSREGWGERMDFGANTFNVAVDFFTSPFDHADQFMLGLSLLFTAGAAFCLARARLPGVFNIYTAGILLLPIVAQTQNLRPRFVLTAFPLFIALGLKVRGQWFLALLAASAALMPLLVVYYSVGFVGPWFAP